MINGSYVMHSHPQAQNLAAASQSGNTASGAGG